MRSLDLYSNLHDWLLIKSTVDSVEEWHGKPTNPRINMSLNDDDDDDDE